MKRESGHTHPPTLLTAMFSYIKRLGYVLTALAVVAFVGCDSGGGAPDEEDPPEPTGAQVTVASNATLGEYLADAEGFSLYLFTDGNGNPVPCTSDACVGAWPIFTTDGEPQAAEGVDASLLSTTDRPDGTVQVVYNDWPLYYFVGDENPGDVNGQRIESFGGIWYLVSPAGTAITGDAGSGGGNDGGGDDDPRY